MKAIWEEGEGSPKETRSLSWGLFMLLSVLVGIVAGMGAVAFRELIAIIHDLSFLGRLSSTYNANVHTPPSIWGAGVVLVPALGAIIVVFLVQKFAPEAKGHGVPEVMDAIYYEKGVIRPIVAFVKSIASATSIGTGGSVGREGPIIQIGASFGSTIAQWLRLFAWQRITLIAAGAGAGIAATFNTPVGGVLFAVEIMLHEVSARTLTSVVIATATATWVGQLFFGPHPSFVIPALERPYFHVTSPWVLAAYVVLGLITGVASALFIRSLYGFEDLFEKHLRRIGYLGRHVTGMLLVGLTMYILFRTTGQYHVEGVGYATIVDVLSQSITSIWFLLLLFGLKLLVTSLTLGSGASGGIFSPALFLGATVGGAFGLFLRILFPALPVSPAAFSVAGMAGMVGGTTGAAMAAIVMIFEMTLDYSVVIPMTITVALSYGVRRLFSRDSIYTLKLARRGHFTPGALQADAHFVQPARRAMDEHFRVVPATMMLSELESALDEAKDVTTVIVRDGTEIAGALSRRIAYGEIIRGQPGQALSEIRLSPCILLDAVSMAVDLFN
jgi:CIC family chloride channel protein